MLALNIDDKSIENVFLHQFNSDKEKFINFIKTSISNINIRQDKKDEITSLQISSMSKTWDNDKDKAWDEL